MIESIKFEGRIILNRHGDYPGIGGEVVHAEIVKPNAEAESFLTDREGVKKLSDASLLNLFENMLRTNISPLDQKLIIVRDVIAKRMEYGGANS